MKFLVGGSGAVVFAVNFTGQIIAEETVPNPLTAIGALVAGFTVMTGLMAWVLRYLLSTTIPAMQVSYQTAMDKQRDTFERTINAQQQLFVDSAKIFQQIVTDSQDGYKKDEKSLMDTFALEQQRQRDLFERGLLAQREFFSKEMQAVMAEFRIDRERFFDAIVTAGEDSSTARTKAGR